MFPDSGVPQVDAVSVPPGAFLLDVREPVEWAAGHVEGAVHVPMAELPARVEQVPADRQVVVVCRSGNRSARVTQWLLGQGRDAVNLDGGMYAWASAGRPMVSDTGAPPAVV